jgi:hypothetical protein
MHQAADHPTPLHLQFRAAVSRFTRTLDLTSIAVSASRSPPSARGCPSASWRRRCAGCAWCAPTSAAAPSCWPRPPVSNCPACLAGWLAGWLHMCITCCTLQADNTTCWYSTAAGRYHTSPPSKAACAALMDHTCPVLCRRRQGAAGVVRAAVRGVRPGHDRVRAAGGHGDAALAAGRQAAAAAQDRRQHHQGV